MRWVTMFFLAAAFISLFAVFKGIKNVVTDPEKNTAGIDHPKKDMNNAKLAHLKNYTGNLKTYVIENNFNSSYCFLIDMKMASGSKRFFIYDLKNDAILQTGLVTHGSGINTLTDSVTFSNEPGSNCTSLGKYKIGKSYYGKFGLAYKLYGLDKTNSNSFNRFVVLHSHPCVPDNEIIPLTICRSLGCPTTSPAFLKQLKMYIDKSPAPILLCILN